MLEVLWQSMGSINTGDQSQLILISMILIHINAQLTPRNMERTRLFSKQTSIARFILTY